jgi:hypothetical protein
MTQVYHASGLQICAVCCPGDNGMDGAGASFLLLQSNNDIYSQGANTGAGAAFTLRDWLEGRRSEIASLPHRTAMDRPAFDAFIGALTHAVGGSYETMRDVFGFSFKPDWSNTRYACVQIHPSIVNE